MILIRVSSLFLTLTFEAVFCYKKSILFKFNFIQISIAEYNFTS